MAFLEIWQEPVERRSVLKWRRFNFYDLKKGVDAAQISKNLGDVRVTTTTSGSGLIVLGDSDGNVHLMSRDFEISTFRAYDRNVSLAEQAREASFLVTIGEDEVGVNPVIKVWNVSKKDRQGHPVCLRISRASLPNRAIPTSTLAVNETLNLMAIGFSDGSVMLYRGDLTRERTNKQKLLKDGAHCVTGLAFRTTANATYLFVSTVNSVILYNVTHKDKEIKTSLDSIGCMLRCSMLAEGLQDTQFMIAKDDAVYCYTTDGRGPCYAVEGEKLLLQWFRGFLIIISKDNKPPTRAATTSSAPPLSVGGDCHTVTVLDIQNKFLVFSAPLHGVSSVLTEWGSLYILTAQHTLYQLQEKDLQTKLALLFKKNLYDVAIRIAKSQQYDAEGLIDIFRQYGDHLYSKGDHTSAIDQYIRTIGKLEPSYVIRKYLDSQQIDNLTNYLNALHKQGVATSDHTTLLINCYTKLNNVDKLKKFIMTKDREVDFDVEVAIKACRYASCEDALLLAEKHSLHEWYLKIQIEDQQKFSAALDYIGRLDFCQAESNMRKYGNTLLQNAPAETSQLLKKLCSNYRPANKPLVDAITLDGSLGRVDRACPDDFIHLFLNHSEMLIDFLENLAEMPLSCTAYTTLLEHRLQVWTGLSDPASRVQCEQKIKRLLESPNAAYDKHQALIFCQAAKYKAGVLYLYEENKLYLQILNVHLSNRDFPSVLACCRRFGYLDPSLWVHALWVVAKEPQLPPHVLPEILSVIEKDRLLAPLLVLDALCDSTTVGVGAVRSYLSSVLQSEARVTGHEQSLIEKYTQETVKIRAHIRDIQTKPIVFQGSRCSACNNQLELPAIHFLCQHSFHQHCFQSFAESENECPACLPINKQISDVIRSQEASRDLHESFHSQLERSEDPLSLVADYLGRGVFTKLTLINEATLRAAALKSIAALEASPWPSVLPTTNLSIGKSAVKKDDVVKTGLNSTKEVSVIRGTSQPRQKLEVENRYSLSLEANLSRSAAQIPSTNHSASDKLTPSIITSNSHPSNATLQNPFYDESKNPFKEDVDDDYDRNLNPFGSS